MRILVADDDRVCGSQLLAVLSEWGYDPILCCSGHEAWARLQAHDAPRLAILDWIMPGIEGPEICRRLRRVETDRYTQIILLTVRGDKRDLAAGIDAGADDYIAKPFDLMELRARLSAAVRNLRAHEQLLATREALRQEAMKDSLTGLWNRPAILQLLQQELARSRRERTCLGVAIVDLDRFKSVNDALGHRAGDLVLRDVAQRMAGCLRPYDGLGRYGGDEFLLVVPNTSSGGLDEIVARMRAEVCGTPIDVGGRPVYQSVAIGVATTDARAQASCDELVEAADRAMLQAKGSRRCSTFDADQTKAKAASMSMAKPRSG